MNDDYDDKKILVIDNSPVMTKIIKNNLVKIGFLDENIYTANDGHQASLMIELVDFNLVTSGLHMKFKDGLELLKSIRQAREETVKNTPFLVISSEKRDYFFKELEKAGVSGYLEKPFKSSQFEQTINHIFNPETDDFPESEPNPETPVAIKTPLKRSATFKPEIIALFAESAVEALGQYMVVAEPGEPVEGEDLYGDFSSKIQLLACDHDVTLTIILYFPKNVACQIYEGIFGEVKLEEVCGVVHELGNIIGGNVKPKLAEFSKDIFSLVHPGKEWIDPDGEEGGMKFDLGFPKAVMSDKHTVDIEETAPRFVLPLQVNNETITLVSVFQKNPDGPETA
ncbi:MAG: response regulator [Nitrospinales bacterium]